MQTTAPDQEYFDWLISQIEIPKTFKKTFHDLCVHLHNTEFLWQVPGDDNRVSDARDLRHGFINIEFKEYISVLEIMIHLSQLLEFVAGGTAGEWAWRLIDNLQLNHVYDPLSIEQLGVVNNILENLIWRTYDYNGHGGFFPLINPQEDQRKVELWYQLNTYVSEIVQE